MALHPQQRSKSTGSKSPSKARAGTPAKHSFAKSTVAHPNHRRATNGDKKPKSTKGGRVAVKHEELSKKHWKKGGSAEKRSKKPPKDGQVWSKSKKKRMRALKAKGRTDGSAIVQDQAVIQDSQSQESRKKALVAAPTISIPSTKKNKDESGTSKLQKHFQDRLSGSRFRILNEELYTTRSNDALQRFQANPTLFDEYHEGFRQQVSHWPVNPVSILCNKIQQFVGDSSESLVVADFGCGDADLARQLQTSPITVHSFDLVARGPNAELITACDIAKTPLEKASVDIGVFCLSLMGTNLADFIREAHRVLKPNGVLHIAEVRSRFEDMKEDEESTSLTPFLNALNKLGFECVDMDRSNTMFVLIELRKNGMNPNPTLAYTAKPCIYKRR